MEVLDNISWKQLGDRVVAVDTNSGDYYTFNDVASAIWVAIANKMTIDDTVTRIMEEYDITDDAKVRQDIDTQIAKWKEMKLMS